MNAAILDSDMLSEFLKRRNARVLANAQAYYALHGTFAVSAYTRLEVRRGMLEKGATKALANFEIFCGHSLVVPISDPVLDRACELWVTARKGGHPHGDADLIIAATALEERRELVTGNIKHHSWIPNLTLINWRF